jgi:enoyl-CoA hydratase/carnithine racemase
MHMTGGLKVEQDGHVTILTLDRPEAMNALDYPTYMALEDAVRGADARAIVITGAGDRAFCSGDDVKQILSKGAPTTPEMAERAKKTGGLTPAADALLHTDIPVIAAVNGFALGWGAELAIMADIRVFSEKARFGEIFVTRG